MAECSSCGAETPCREYQGRRDRYGYGIREIGERRSGRRRKAVKVHRWVWTQIHGPIPDGMVIMHTCDNPPCFRYDHLRMGTQAENLSDMRAKGRGGPPPPRRGMDNHQARLTDAQGEEIRGLRGTASSRVIAERFGVSSAHVRDIWLGRGRWH